MHAGTSPELVEMTTGMQTRDGSRETPAGARDRVQGTGYRETMQTPAGSRETPADIFKKHDRDASNDIDVQELRAALQDLRQHSGLSAPTEQQSAAILRKYECVSDLRPRNKLSPLTLTLLRVTCAHSLVQFVLAALMATAASISKSSST